jgi:hypothetical protein
VYHSFHKAGIQDTYAYNRRDQKHVDPHKCKKDLETQKITLKPLEVPASEPPPAARLWRLCSAREREGRKPAHPSSTRLHRCKQLCEPQKWVVEDDTFAAGARRSGPRPKPFIELRIQSSPSTTSRRRIRSAGLLPSQPEQILPSSGPLSAWPA